MPDDEAWMLLFIAATLFVVAIAIFLVTKQPVPQ